MPLAEIENRFRRISMTEKKKKKACNPESDWSEAKGEILHPSQPWVPNL